MKCNRFGSSKRFVGCCCCRPFLGKEPAVFFFYLNIFILFLLLRLIFMNMIASMIWLGRATSAGYSNDGEPWSYWTDILRGSRQPNNLVIGHISLSRFQSQSMASHRLILFISYKQVEKRKFSIIKWSKREGTGEILQTRGVATWKHCEFRWIDCKLFTMNGARPSIS